ELDLANTVRRDLMDLDGLFEEPSSMEEHELEWQLAVTPQRAIRAETDLAMLIVGEGFDRLGQIDRGLGIRSAGQLLRARRHVVETERRGRGCRQRDCHQGQKRYACSYRRVRPHACLPSPVS